MSGRAADPQHEALEKARKLLNLQADTMLKWQQTRTEVWKVAVSALTGGAALLAAGAATGGFLAKAFSH